MNARSIAMGLLSIALAACGGGTDSDEAKTPDPKKYSFSVGNSDSVEWPIGEPRTIAVPSGQRIFVTTAAPVTWSIKHSGGSTQGFGNTVLTQGVAVVEETTSNPSRNWVASISGKTPSFTTQAFELVIETQPKTVLAFFVAQ